MSPGTKNLDRFLAAEELQSQSSEKAAQSGGWQVGGIMIDPRRRVAVLDPPISVASREEISGSEDKHYRNNDEILALLHGEWWLAERQRPPDAFSGRLCCAWFGACISPRAAQDGLLAVAVQVGRGRTQNQLLPLWSEVHLV